MTKHFKKGDLLQMVNCDHLYGDAIINGDLVIYMNVHSDYYVKEHRVWHIKMKRFHYHTGEELLEKAIRND